MNFFETLFLKEAERFIAELDSKVAKKIFFNIDIAERTNDPRLFKILKNDIWEFRMVYSGLQIRLLAFWDKSQSTHTLVIATHGFIKKQQKTLAREIERAELIRKKYFESKNEK